ncbi:hypothetical protein J7J84_02735 [bacterium]|nr:hypothetical protein [bacterium]
MILSNWLVFFAESNGGDGDGGSGGTSGEGGDTQPSVPPFDPDAEQIIERKIPDPEPDPKAESISTYERDQEPNRHSRSKGGVKQ